MAEAVYRQDTGQVQDICGVTNVRDQRAVPRKVNVSAECRGPPSRSGVGGGGVGQSSAAAGGRGCGETDARVTEGRDDALGICLVIDTNLAFVAMCLAAACGHHDVVEFIGNAGQRHRGAQPRTGDEARVEGGSRQGRF